MKRRNVDNVKLRRTMKKSRLADSMCSGGLVYVKLLVVWALLMMADFLLGVRFEYLWPFWLLIRSIYDSFRYQGVAFSVFFVCITVTSDLVCFLFIPVQWMFFFASTYVWFQYVWHADRGVCLPTVSLWLLFFCFEASVRLKELSSSRSSIPFTLDLCRPFAAHCIGYPVVTLGFGVKTYVGYKFRLRKQREVARDNAVYVRLLHEALPQSSAQWYSPGGSVLALERPEMQRYVSSEAALEDEISNGLPDVGGGASMLLPYSPPVKSHAGAHQHLVANGKSSAPCLDDGAVAATADGTPRLLCWLGALRRRLFGDARARPPSSRSSGRASDDDDDDRESSRGSTVDGAVSKRSTAGVCGPPRSRGSGVRRRLVPAAASYDRAQAKDFLDVQTDSSTQCDAESQPILNSVPDRRDSFAHKDKAERLEVEVEKLRTDLQLSRSNELELRVHVQQLISSEKSAKSDLHSVRQKSEQLEVKLQNQLRSREQDKQAVQKLEKRLVEEQKQKVELEQQMAHDRKQKRSEDAAAARALAAATTGKSECGEHCKARRREVERLRGELRARDDKVGQLEAELHSLRQYKEAHNAEILMSALATMKEKIAHLEQSLSAENRVKQDLFKTLAESKRQMETLQSHLLTKDREVQELRRQSCVDSSGGALTPPPPAPMMANDAVSEPSMQMLTSAMYSAAAYLSTTQGRGAALGGPLAQPPFDGSDQSNVIPAAPTSRYSPPRSS